MFCSRCGKANFDDARFCRFCSAALGPYQATVGQSPTQLRNPGLAAVMSFFICGLGQIYNGQITKGIILIIFYALSVLSCYLLIGFVSTPILWVWGIIDAYRGALKLNSDLIAGAVVPNPSTGQVILNLGVVLLILVLLGGVIVVFLLGHGHSLTE